MSRVRLAENLYVQLSISPPLPPCGSPISSSKRTTTPAGFFPSLSLSLSLSLSARRSPRLRRPRVLRLRRALPSPRFPRRGRRLPLARLESALGALLFFPRSKICDCFLIPVLHPSDRLSGSKSGGGLASSRGLLCGGAFFCAGGALATGVTDEDGSNARFGTCAGFCGRGAVGWPAVSTML